MPVAALPSPVNGLWHLGPVPVHAYALCVVLAALALLWITERRYRAVGGRPWLMTDMATVAIPAGLIGGRLYRVVVGYRWYFGPHHDWVNVLRIWDGGIALPAAAACGLGVVWLCSRLTQVRIGPVLAAAAPGLAFGQAIAVLGNWFTQSMYGQPSTLPWAVAISPAHRVPGFTNVSTFQPLFLYESIWDVVIGIALIYLIATLTLTGDRALALCVGLYAIGRLGIASLLLTGTTPVSGVRAEQVAASVAILAAAAYLYLTRAKRGPEPLIALPQARRTDHDLPNGAASGDLSSGTSGRVPVEPAENEVNVAQDGSARARSGPGPGLTRVLPGQVAHGWMSTDVEYRVPG